MGQQVRRLVTFDAFGTLFTPKEPIPKQYGDAARRRGLSGFTNEDVGESFRKGCRARPLEWNSRELITEYSLR